MLTSSIFSQLTSRLRTIISHLRLFDTSDDLGPIPYQPYDLLQSGTTRSSRSYRATHCNSRDGRLARPRERDAGRHEHYGARFTQDAQTVYLSCWLPQVLKDKLSPSQRGKLELLIPQYPDALTENLGLTHLRECEIQLLEATAVRLAPYRLARPKIHYLWEHTKMLLRDGVIEHSLSSYSSPIFLVPKPGELTVLYSITDYWKNALQ